MEPSQDENLVQLLQLIRASRDLWYLNEAPELSERLYGGLSGKALEKKALKQSTSADIEKKRKAALAFKYFLVKQRFESSEDTKKTIERLLKLEPSLSNLMLDVTKAGLNYIDQCLEHKKLLVPKEMDEIILGRYAKSYDNLLFYEKPFVTLVHEHEGRCNIHTIKDETKALIYKDDTDKLGEKRTDGLFSIMPHTKKFDGPLEDACEYIRSKQTEPNIISTFSVPLCRYVTERYTHMRVWEAFKTADMTLDGPSVFSEANIRFIS